jgi:putative hydrolase of the HAD superfamily
MLADVRRLMPIAIVTNGAPRVQAGKIAALGLRPLVDAVVFAEACGSGAGKPEAAAFLTAAAALGVAPAHCAFTGNDEAADIRGARAAGMKTIHIRHAGRPASLCADTAVDDVSQVGGILARWSLQEETTLCA